MTLFQFCSDWKLAKEMNLKVNESLYTNENSLLLCHFDLWLFVQDDANLSFATQMKWKIDIRNIEVESDSITKL